MVNCISFFEYGEVGVKKIKNEVAFNFIGIKVLIYRILDYFMKS